MTDVVAQCMKCRQPRTMTEPKAVVLKNGRDASEGKCPVCGTKLFRMGKLATV